MFSSSQTRERLLLSAVIAMLTAWWWTGPRDPPNPGAAVSPPVPGCALEASRSAALPVAASAPATTDAPHRFHSDAPRSAQPESMVATPGAPITGEVPSWEVFAESEEASLYANAEAVESELASLVAAQAVDPEFRALAQMRIEGTLSELAAPGMQLVSTDCRWSLCRLDLQHAERDSIDEFLDRFPLLLGWNTEMSSRVRGDDYTGFATTVFIARDGFQLPLLASDP